MIKKYFLLNVLFTLSFISHAAPLDPVQLLSDFVGVDTVNPPGNESRAVDFSLIFLNKRALNIQAQRALLAEEISGLELKAGIYQP